MRLGYACINLSVPGTFRSCRLKSVQDNDIAFIRNIAIHNFNRVLSILKWNKANNIKLYRLSSDLIPFGSHDILFSWDWWNDPELDRISSECRKLSKSSGMRITIHPGQYNNLSSPSSSVIRSTLKDLVFQTRLLRAFGGTDMVLHVGGRYEGRAPSIVRFKERFRALPEEIRNYLRIENDDKVYTISDVLDICYDLKAKPMYDYHHDRCLPSLKICDVKKGLRELWGDNRIKVHLSSGVRGDKDRSHADFISSSTWSSFSYDFEDMPDIDVMLETKKKELSVFRVRGYSEVGIGGKLRE